MISAQERHGGVSIATDQRCCGKVEGLRQRGEHDAAGSSAGIFARTTSKLPYFPNSPEYDWSEDNFGPIYIPKQGATVKLDLHVLPLYERVIRVYEHNDLEVRDGRILINGKVPTATPSSRTTSG